MTLFPDEKTARAAVDRIKARIAAGNKNSLPARYQYEVYVNRKNGTAVIRVYDKKLILRGHL